MTQLPSLNAENLSKSFSGTEVVSNVSLTLRPGEVTAIIGQSGAGKSTLLRLLAGMERPDAGRILRGGTVLSSTSEFIPIEKRRTGLVFQDFALFPSMTAAQNIEFGLHKTPKEDRAHIVETWLGELNLKHLRQAYPHQLSGGEQQRVAIARALAPEPQTILLDEPFSGLDHNLRNQTRRAAFKAIRKTGAPALITTHDSAEALSLSDQMGVMLQGKLLQIGTPDDIYLRPNSIDVARSVGPVASAETSTLPEAWTQYFKSDSQAYWRPEALQFDPSSPVRLSVLRAQRRGALIRVTLKLGDKRTKSLMLLDALPQIGTDLPVRLNPAYILQFS